MSASSTKATQTLREIDKLEKIGLDGVCAMLGAGHKDASGAFNVGVGLDPLQVGMVRMFLTDNIGQTNEETLDLLSKKMALLGQIRSRIDVMVFLEETIVNHRTGETAWERLLDMPQNADETWGANSRPANIAWALDDIVKAVKPKDASRS